MGGGHYDSNGICVLGNIDSANIFGDYPTGGGSGPAGSGPSIPNDGTTIDGRNSRNSDPCAGEGGTGSPKVGNPIIPATGNKIEPELDFTSTGEMPLSLMRVYNHYWTGVGLFGKHWVSSFDYKLTFGATTVNACYPRAGGTPCGVGTNTVIYAWRPDGRTVKYIKNATDGIFYEDKPGPVARIVKQADGSFVLYGEENEVEKYSSAGYVAEVKDSYGIGWTFGYSPTAPTYLSRVTHTSGRYVEFTWTGSQLTSVRDPAGNFYGYAYNANTFGMGIHRLAATSKPGAPTTTIAYHYEVAADPGALTGKSFNNVRYSTFTYDDQGYATGTEHNGKSKFTLVYTPGTDGALTVVTTNPLGKRSTYSFVNGQLHSVTGHVSSYCPSTYAETVYDANNYPQLVSDFNGNDTQFSYNAKGQLMQRVEAYGTALARTTVFVWEARSTALSARQPTAFSARNTRTRPTIELPRSRSSTFLPTA
ncbi:hypothetical protein GCM10027432_12010 [Lysobacter fragariae]